MNKMYIIVIPIASIHNYKEQNHMLSWTVKHYVIVLVYSSSRALDQGQDLG